MARTGAGVEQPDSRARCADLLDDRRELGRHDTKPAGPEERAAGLDHLAVIAFVPEAPGTAVESHAAVARDIEAMPERAHEAPVLRAQTPAAMRTGEYLRGASKRHRNRIGRASGSGRTPAWPRGHRGNT